MIERRFPGFPARHRLRSSDVFPVSRPGTDSEAAAGQRSAGSAWSFGGGRAPCWRAITFVSSAPKKKKINDA
jgi:hypothetical protein